MKHKAESKVRLSVGEFVVPLTLTAGTLEHVACVRVSNTTGQCPCLPDEVARGNDTRSAACCNT